MPSSGPFRKQIAPTLRTLKDLITAAQELIDGEDQNAVIPAANLHQLNIQRASLESTMRRIRDQNEKWIQLLEGLEGDALAAEETIYDNFPPAQQANDDDEEEHEHFMETYERGQAMVDLIHATIATVNQPVNHQPQPVNPQPPPVNPQPPPANQQPLFNAPPPLILPNVRLPTLELPKFDSDPRHYRTWWSAFSIAVDEQSISAYQKHTYLLMCLPTNSPARKAIEHYEPSDVNYPRVKEILQERFGNEKRLTEALFTELMHLPRASNTTASLRAFNDTVDRICYQLEARGETPSSSQTLLQIRSKLPEPVVRELLLKEKAAGTVWKYDDMRKALREIVEMKEEVQHCVGGQGQGEASHSAGNRERKSPPTPQKEVTRSFAAATPARPFRRGCCSLCEGPKHKPSNCPNYPTPNDRLRRLRQMNRCINCLREGHQVGDCSAEDRCGTCGKKHHFIVCFKAQNAPQSTNQQHKQPTTTEQRSDTQHKRNRRSNNNRSDHRNKRRPQSGAQPNHSTSGQSTNTSLVASAGPEGNSTTVCSLSSTMPNSKKPHAFLLTRKLMVTADRRRLSLPVVVLFDPGSMTSFITKKLADQLKPPRVGREQQEVDVFGGSVNGPLRFDSPLYAVKLQRLDGGWEKVTLNRTQKICNRFATAEWLADIPDSATMPEVQDAINFKNAEPDIMISTRQFWKYFVSKREIADGTFLIETVFGQLIGGEADFGPSKQQSTLSMVTTPHHEEPPASAAKMEEWLTLEGIGIKEDPTLNDDEQAVHLFEQSIHQRPDGHYSTKWPWIHAEPTLPSYFRMAYSRLSSVYRSLQTRGDLLSKYDAVFQDQLQRGMLEPAERNPGGVECYLPHHAVVTEKKVRPVVDGSAHTRGQPALNHQLYRGPPGIPQLVGLNMRHRLPRIALIGDLEKAFMSIYLDPGIDREVCKILWLKDISKPPSPDNLQIWRYTVVGFGIISSPFILSAVVRHHLQKCGQRAAALIDDLYVDNQLIGCDSPEEAKEAYHFLKNVYGKAKMNIREFISNSAEVNQSIPPEDRLEGPIVKFLGVQWDTEQDRLSFSFPSMDESRPTTRRTVFSTLHKVFDPAGLVYPCLLSAKLFAQALWDVSQSWDEPLSEQLTTDWISIISRWQGDPIHIPRRCVLDDTTSIELHVFTDASNNALATAAYLRCTSNKCTISNLIFCKGRLKPKKAGKSLTIPRMELLALLIGVRAKAFINAQLKLPLSAIHIWSDSQIALSWVKSSEQQPSFVQRRLIEIRRHNDCIFHYVRTTDNPADIATRGADPSKLSNSPLWWHGPEWLTQSPDQWPTELQFTLESDEEDEPNTTPMDEEALTGPGVFVTTQLQSSDSGVVVTTQPQSSDSGVLVTTQPKKVKEALPAPIIDASRYSSLKKLLHITCYVLRFAHISKGRGAFTSEELTRAEEYLIRLDQKRHMAQFGNYRSIKDEVGILRLQTRIGNHEETNTSSDIGSPILLPRSSALTKLIIEDKYERLRQAISANIGSPILLSRSSALTKLIIKDTHERLLHMGVDWTLGEFLSSYWTPQARRLVKTIIHSCLKCARMKSYPFARPEMPPLPHGRVNRTRPFSLVGCDYLGPTTVKIGSERSKAYIVLFTCLTTRGVYLEPTLDLSALSFTNVLRRFISRRGCPTQITSDNGTQFVLTSKALRELTKSNSTDNLLHDRQWTVSNVQWKFLPQLSPWMGGFYERIVKTVKDCFTRTLGRRILTLDELATFTAEVEAVINQRPLTSVSDQSDAPRPLRPIDLIQPGAFIDLAITNRDLDQLDRPLPEENLALWWKNTQEAADMFWERWQTEYLAILRQRSAWTHRGPRLQTHASPKLGQPVLIGDDFRPRNSWLMGIVTQLNGTSPNIRSVQLRLPSGRILTRPVSKLYPMEMDYPEPVPHSEHDEGKSEPREENHTPEQISESELGRATHQMVRRSQTRKQAAIGTTLAVCLTLICGLFTLGKAQPNSCHECTLQCTDQGVFTAMPSTIAKLELCCEGSCLIRQAPRNFTLELPPDILVQNYACEAHFWNATSQGHTTHILCPALDNCKLINCHFCLDHIANPSCSPRWAAMLLGLLLCSLIVITCCGLTLLRAFGANFRTLIWVFSCSLGSCILLTRLFRRKARAIRRSTPVVELRARAQQTRNRLTRLGGIARAAGEEWRHAHLNQIIRPELIALAVFFSLIAVCSASATISVTTKAESCKRGATGLTCHINTATTMTLLPRGQSSTLLLRDEHGIALGSLTVIVEALTMECLQRSDGWFRSYKVETLASKRCPSAGSCKEKFCQQVRPHTLISELKDANSYPGASYCTPSSSFWFHGCGLPTDACLFHRFYAKPASDIVFELLSCPTWDFKLRTKLTLEASGRTPLTASIALHPGMSLHWHNITLTPIAASVPPVPVLASNFITDGQSVAIVPPFHRDLFCANEGEAKRFNCTLATSTCADCILDHHEGSASCNCRELNLDQVLEDASARLPLSVSRLQLRNDHNRIYADYGYSPIQLHLEMANLELLLEFQDSKCQVEVHNLTGCYKCNAGAHLYYTCSTDHGSTLAKVECSDGTLFSAHCSKNGTTAREILPFDHYQISTKCVVDCPAGETTFKLEGELFYIPVKRQQGYSHRDSENLDQPSGSWWDYGFDRAAVLRLLLSSYGIGIILPTILVGILALYIFMKLNPAFRAYKTAARLLVILAFSASLAAGGSQWDTSSDLAPPLGEETSSAFAPQLGHAPSCAKAVPFKGTPSFPNFNFSENSDFKFPPNLKMELLRSGPSRLDLWIDWHVPPLGILWHQPNSNNRNQAMAIITQRLGMGDQLWLNSPNRPSRPIFGYAGITTGSVNIELIQPGQTVYQYYTAKGIHISRPGLPCLKVNMTATETNNSANAHGVRGTSRRSRHQQAIRGQPCWRQGQAHFDLIPLELIKWKSTRPAPFHFRSLSLSSSEDSDDQFSPWPQPPSTNERGRSFMQQLNTGRLRPTYMFPADRRNNSTMGSHHPQSTNARPHWQSTEHFRSLQQQSTNARPHGQSTERFRSLQQQSTNARPHGQSTERFRSLQPQSTNSRLTYGHPSPANRHHHLQPILIGPPAALHSDLGSNNNNNGLPALSNLFIWPASIGNGNFRRQSAPPIGLSPSFPSYPMALFGFLLCAMATVATPFPVPLASAPQIGPIHHFAKLLQIPRIAQFPRSSPMAQQLINLLSSDKKDRLHMELQNPAVCLVCAKLQLDPIGHRPGDRMCPGYEQGYRRDSWHQRLGLEKEEIRRKKAALIRQLGIQTGRKRKAPSSDLNNTPQSTAHPATSQSTAHPPILPPAADNAMERPTGQPRGGPGKGKGNLRRSYFPPRPCTRPIRRKKESTDEDYSPTRQGSDQWPVKHRKETPAPKATTPRMAITPPLPPKEARERHHSDPSSSEEEEDTAEPRLIIDESPLTVESSLEEGSGQQQIHSSIYELPPPTPPIRQTGTTRLGDPRIELGRKSKPLPRQLPLPFFGHLFLAKYRIPRVTKMEAELIKIPQRESANLVNKLTATYQVAATIEGRPTPRNPTAVRTTSARIHRTTEYESRQNKLQQLMAQLKAEENSTSALLRRLPYATRHYLALLESPQSPPGSPPATSENYSYSGTFASTATDNNPGSSGNDTYIGTPSSPSPIEIVLPSTSTTINVEPYSPQSPSAETTTMARSTQFPFLNKAYWHSPPSPTSSKLLDLYETAKFQMDSVMDLLKERPSFQRAQASGDKEVEAFVTIN